MDKEMKSFIRKSGRYFAYGVMDALSIFFVFYLIFSLALMAVIPIDNSDKGKFDRSGVKIVTDNLTGIEYLVTPKGHITPRLRETP